MIIKNYRVLQLHVPWFIVTMCISTIIIYLVTQAYCNTSLALAIDIN